MPSENLIKNITSKDINLSISTIKNMLKSANIEDFSLLCEKADFIFPFLKERIIRDFVKIVEECDLKIIFEFSKIYCADFEDLIVNSWIKFASEDLTDEILALFENGVQEQKAYCAKYFSRIQDPLALEYLNKFALNDFEPLKTNCALALSAFNDVEILNKMKNVVLNSQDEFEKLNAFNFISTYGKDEQIKFVIENCFKSPFLINILSNILDFNDINYLKNILDKNVLSRILQVVIEEYPEEISLDTCYYWNLIELMKLIYSFNNQYSKNILLIAKQKFGEFSSSDIYTFDFDKNVKTEIKNILNYLNSLNLSVDEIKQELAAFEDNYRYAIALDVVREYQLNNFAIDISKLINDNKLTDEQKASSALVLKGLNSINLIDKNIIEKIENENIKALIKSYF
ncbi:MAG: hypothetical protein IKL52_04865 [Candidatus Gastranaerophilales bacterium]|nr:hypothetical protein [Candidatus Gastranaerophilales bacterium]